LALSSQITPPARHALCPAARCRNQLILDQSVNLRNLRTRIKPLSSRVKIVTLHDLCSVGLIGQTAKLLSLD
jgi:hypothetical protein